MQGPHNRAVPCPLCNEKFFPASLPFHQRQCQKRRGARVVNCPYCNVEVSQLALPDHIKQCPKGAGGRDRSRPPRGGDGGGGGGAAAAPPSRDLGPANFDPEVLDDGRMRCVYCGRYFNSDRIDKHQSICGKLKSARPVGVDGEPTQTGRKIFNSKAQRVEGGGAAFVSPEQYKRNLALLAKTAEEERARRTRTGNAWRRQHAQFQAACHAGRDDVGSPQARVPRNAATHGGAAGDGMTQCPHCARRFEPSVAERHIPICANVVNRPRAPPTSPGPSSRELSEPPSPPPRASSLGSGGAGGRRLQQQRTQPQLQQQQQEQRRSQQQWHQHQQERPEPQPSSRFPPPPRSSQGQRAMQQSAGSSLSSSCGRLPSLAGEPPSPGAPGFNGATLKTPPTPGGAGTQAARSLRGSGAASTSRLPGIGTPRGSSAGSSLPSARGGSGGGGGASGGGGGGPRYDRAAARFQQQQPPLEPSANDVLTIRDEGALDKTFLQPRRTPEPTCTDTTDGHSPAHAARHTSGSSGTAVARMGLRRSAMLYRLLSQVPRAALEREVLDAGGTRGGLAVEKLDEEGLIEAVLDQLA